MDVKTDKRTFVMNASGKDSFVMRRDGKLSEVVCKSGDWIEIPPDSVCPRAAAAAAGAPAKIWGAAKLLVVPRWMGRRLFLPRVAACREEAGEPVSEGICKKGWLCK